MIAAANRRTAFGLVCAAKGVRGLSYTLEYADDASGFEEVVELEDGVKILIDPKAIMFVLGTEMDYEVNKMEEGFVFVTPTKKVVAGAGNPSTSDRPGFPCFLFGHGPGFIAGAIG